METNFWALPKLESYQFWDAKKISKSTNFINIMETNFRAIKNLESYQLWYVTKFENLSILGRYQI